MIKKKSTRKYSNQKYNDLGLGEKASAGAFRSINKDGSFNIKKKNVPFFERINFFHDLVSMSWRRFFGIIFIIYLSINLLFASIYLWIGAEDLTGIQGSTALDVFIEAFFFSAQTITTLGYGRVAPVGLFDNIVAAIESLLGLLSFALATGLIYGRFSKPTAKIRYSNPAVIAPYQDINGLMFRVVNPHANQLMEVEVTVAMSMQKENSDQRDFFNLDLERSKVAFMPSTWTIVHPISDTSPLYGLTEAEVLARDIEVIIMMKAFDESFSQTVYSRSSYKASEIRWGHKFVYLITRENESINVDVSRIDETEKASLNLVTISKKINQ
ncbi:MAG: K+ channel, inward rectifier [Flavobacteriaceae bacterium]|nr:K+ channel, inward rectifier [Flavobacteriaceae bacterium]